MFVHRQSQQFTHQYRNHLEKQYSQPIGGEVRKKIQNYSFLITDKIGKGYSSVVYKGTNDLTGQAMAIKVIELKSLKDQTSKFMLQTEIQCFKETRHANLLRYQNSFFTVNNCYIVTEYCQCGDLSKLIKERGNLSEEQAGAMFYQIYQGYQHLYNAGFIHRDIKPANIFVSSNNILKIADFGFSKRRDLVQRENYNVGTPIYMPKESLAANIYNEKTDVWALGITLYEMVFGSVPFKGKTEKELRAQIERGILKFPDGIPVSQQLKNFISCCLNSDSFQRISIRQMQAHPWIIKQQRRTKTPLVSAYPNHVQSQREEKELRISLPNQGLTHNKSKEYFQQQPSSVDNRRSISSMQRLKLCHPKKPSQILNIPKQPICNRSVGSINLSIPTHNKYQNEISSKLISREVSQNKQNKPSNRASLTISTLPSMNNLNLKKGQSNVRQERVSIIEEDNTRTKVGIQKIVSLINYFRLLYKIIQKIKEANQEIFDSDIKAQISKLKAVVLKDLQRNINIHLQCLSTKQNLFKLNNYFWSEFAASQRWKMYSFVIKRYQVKYQQVLKQGQHQNSDEFYDWRTYFLDFYTKIKQIQVRTTLIGKQLCALCQLSYYLQTLVEMHDYVLELGWQDFTEKYTNSDDFFLQGFTINISNYNEVQQKVKTRYNSMKKKL